MIQRMVGAAARAILVALLIAMPALLVPGVSADTAQMVALISLVAALLTFVEYTSDYPSLVEFRDAPPFNRIRFVALFLTVLALSSIFRNTVDPSAIGGSITTIGGMIGSAMDFPFSPVRLMLLNAPENNSATDSMLMAAAAGLAYTISLLTLLVFVGLVRWLDWPTRKGAFNFWVNLPLYDPTIGDDIVSRLKRDSQVNVALGFLLPFLVPAVLKLASLYFQQMNWGDPQTVIWVMSAWAFLPASLMMRGVALMRIAELIELKRRRAYAEADLQMA